MNKAYGIWCLRNKCGATSSAAAAAIEPSPAFQRRGSVHIDVPVAERRLRLIGKLNAYTFVLLALVSLPAFAQQRPLITEDVVTVKPGAVRFEAGFDFLQDKDYTVSGLNRDLARLGIVSLTFGLASNVEVEAGGVIQNFLSINQRFRPSAVPLQLSHTNS